MTPMLPTTLSRRTCALLAATPLLTAVSAAQAAVATYDVDFQATWSSATHPGAYPFGAHFSPLIGATHDGGVSFWAPGGIASPGIESMAETGGTSSLTAEINAAIGAGNAASVITGPAIGSRASTATSFTLTADHPEVTLVTMIAPSPDWFVGVHGLDLRASGSWADQVTVPLFAYDAGTDSGLNFTSPNQDTNPQDPITLLTGGPFFGTTPLGSFTFTRRASYEPYGCGINPAGSLTLSAPPTIGDSVTFGLHDPVGTMGTPSATTLVISPDGVPATPCGLILPGIALGGVGANGEVLLTTTPILLNGPAWNGTGVSIAQPVPNLPGLVSTTFYAQGYLIDPSARIGVTEALELVVGP